MTRDDITIDDFTILEIEEFEVPESVLQHKSSKRLHELISKL